MGKNENYAKALALLSTLSNEERDSFIREVMDKLGAPSSNEVEDSFEGSRCGKIVEETHPHRPDCPRCGAKADLGYIVKDGKRNGVQSYECKACSKKFRATTNTVFQGTRKNSETWRKFIEMTISQKTIAECVAECDICIQTAQNWRHKVLNAFVVNQEGMQMSGTVEVDDKFRSVSYKGNHVKGSFGIRRCPHGDDNGLPRKSYRRGTDNKGNVHQKACILCMVQDGNKAYFASVPGIGPANAAMLQATIGKHVKKDASRIFSDNARDMVRFLEENNYQYRAFASNVSDNRNDHKPEIDGDEHIQHVNNFHTRLGKFLCRYNGVSTKYLGNYVALFAWLDNIRASKQRKSAKTVSTARAATHDCYITSKEICNRPSLPTCSAA